MSTRRFFARPSAVVLVSTGSLAALPTTVTPPLQHAVGGEVLGPPRPRGRPTAASSIGSGRCGSAASRYGRRPRPGASPRRRTTVADLVEQGRRARLDDRPSPSRRTPCRSAAARPGRGWRIVVETLPVRPACLAQLVDPALEASGSPAARPWRPPARSCGPARCASWVAIAFSGCSDGIGGSAAAAWARCPSPSAESTCRRTARVPRTRPGAPSGAPELRRVHRRDGEEHHEEREQQRHHVGERDEPALALLVLLLVVALVRACGAPCAMRPPSPHCGAAGAALGRRAGPAGRR